MPIQPSAAHSYRHLILSQWSPRDFLIYLLTDRYAATGLDTPHRAPLALTFQYWLLFRIPRPCKSRDGAESRVAATTRISENSWRVKWGGNRSNNWNTEYARLLILHIYTCYIFTLYTSIPLMPLPILGFSSPSGRSKPCFSYLASLDAYFHTISPGRVVICLIINTSLAIMCGLT
jgi:hypothetical protein